MKLYDRPCVMGVVNVTPDSFSDGGRYFNPSDAIERGLKLFEAGAAIVDVGGESTRPFASVVDEEEEVRRVLPVVAVLAQHGTVSVDTRRASVARHAVEAGATIINDVGASLANVASSLGVAWVAMHMKGDPQTMQVRPTYRDVVAEVSAHLVARAEEAESLGVREIYIDPGIGFGKTVEHNLALLESVDRLTAQRWPVVVGISRKRFLSLLSPAELRDPPSPSDRMEHSLAAAAWCFSRGVAVVRAHDVVETMQLLTLARRSESLHGRDQRGRS
ncbi:MAG: dihydropteroate synthase [Acidimicrobiales bacterium]